MVVNEEKWVGCVSVKQVTQLLKVTNINVRLKVKGEING